MKATDTPAAPPREESDSLGRVSVPAAALWGAQTQRAIARFAIGGEAMPMELVHAIARLKGVCAVVNARLGRLEAQVAEAIDEAADAVCNGAHAGQFPLSVWQSGSGTQTNMNVNEVLARLAERRLNGRRVHPNDEVNLGQSSNDVVPSAMHLATLAQVQHRLLPALADLSRTLAGKAAQYAGLVKLGRTHLQDAVPLTLGQEIGAWLAQVGIAQRAVEAALPALHGLAIGGSAAGTGLDTHPDFAACVCRELSARTGIALSPAADRFAALAGHEPLLALHGALKVLAVALLKTANDVRLLASGPRAGLGELLLPAHEPGSSIMPGKVDPTQCEALAMVACQVIGNDAAVTAGAGGGHLQLNTFQPLIAHNVLRSVRLLADAVASFDAHCLRGLDRWVQPAEMTEPAAERL